MKSRKSTLWRLRNVVFRFSVFYQRDFLIIFIFMISMLFSLISILSAIDSKSLLQTGKKSGNTLFHFNFLSHHGNLNVFNILNAYIWLLSSMQSRVENAEGKFKILNSAHRSGETRENWNFKMLQFFLSAGEDDLKDDSDFKRFPSHEKMQKLLGCELCLRCFLYSCFPILLIFPEFPFKIDR